MPFDSLVERPVREELVCIDRAIERLKDPEHWCKGHTEVGASYCLLGALLIGIPQDEAVGAAYRALAREARERGYLSLPLFNDSPSTTHADVMAVLYRVRAKFA